MACSKDRTFEMPQVDDNKLMGELKNYHYFNDIFEGDVDYKLISKLENKDYCHFFNDVIEEHVEEVETTSSSFYFKSGAGTSPDELKMNGLKTFKWLF